MRTFPFYLISGNTRQNGIPITIAYIGQNQKRMVQLASLIMENCHSKRAGEYLPAGLITHLKTNFPNCTLLLMEKDLPGAGADVAENGFPLPYFMQTYIDISVPMERLIERSRSGFNNTRRLITKYNLSYEMTKSPAAQIDFYNNMYLPYLSRRHGASFQQVNFEGIFTDLFPHEMILIKNMDECIAGGVLHFKNEKVYFGFLGVKDGLFEIVSKGALSAAYYFLCDEMHKRGIKRLYLGGSSPFLKNPITAYKIRMTAQIDKDYHYENHELVSMFLLNDSAATRDFLNYSPFVYINNSGVNVGTVWVDKRQKPSVEEVTNEVLRTFRLGLDECQIIYWGKKPKIDPVPREYKNKTIRFVSARKYFDSKWIVNLKKIEMKVSDFSKAGFRGFDEAGYLAANPDVAQAVKEGKISSGKKHYRKFGRKEGRNMKDSPLKK